nr:hypothetical protein [Tanacetum cinerariifolium]
MPSEVVDKGKDHLVCHEIDAFMYDTDCDASICGKEGDLETWMSDETDEQDNEVDWLQDPYHCGDEVVKLKW